MEPWSDPAHLCVCHCSAQSSCSPVIPLPKIPSSGCRTTKAHCIRARVQSALTLVEGIPMAVKLNYSQLFYFLGHHRLPSLWKRKSSKVKQVPAVNRPCRKEKGLTSAGRRRNPAQIPEGVLFSWGCHCPLPLTQVQGKSLPLKGCTSFGFLFPWHGVFFVKSSIILIK